MKIIQFFKDWTLLWALIVGSIIYLLFSRIGVLEPVGDTLGPFFVALLPINIFLMLYITFCKMNFHDMRPRKWHFILQAIRTALAGLAVIACNLCTTVDMKILCEGIFISCICPTAAAAPVIVEKLGGSIGSLTVYLLIANAVTVVIIPTFFPLVEKGANITFMMAFLMVLKKVLEVMILPLVCAVLSRRWLKGFVEWLKQFHNLSLYIWSFNLTIIMGLALKQILSAPVSGFMLFMLALIPLVLCILQFTIGKIVGHHYGDSIGAGQALGQKNTVVGIWLTLSFLNPYAAISPCIYVVWQNLINAIQIWYKGKYGYLKW